MQGVRAKTLAARRGGSIRAPRSIRHVAKEWVFSESRLFADGRDLFPFRCSMSYDVAVDSAESVALLPDFSADSPRSLPRHGGASLQSPLGTKGSRMPSGKDITGGGSAGGGGKRNGGGNMSSGTTGGPKKNAYCSFCRKSYRDVGPLVEGPGDVYICGDCIELCQQILDQERKRRGVPKTLFTDIPTPARDQGTARRLRDRPGARQEGPVGRRA